MGFKGQAEFQIEIVAGRIHFGSTGLTASLGLIRDGKLQPIAVARQCARHRHEYGRRCPSEVRKAGGFTVASDAKHLISKKTGFARLDRICDITREALKDAAAVLIEVANHQLEEKFSARW